MDLLLETKEKSYLASTNHKFITATTPTTAASPLMCHACAEERYVRQIVNNTNQPVYFNNYFRFAPPPPPPPPPPPVAALSQEPEVVLKTPTADCDDRCCWRVMTSSSTSNRKHNANKATGSRKPARRCVYSDVEENETLKKNDAMLTMSSLKTKPGDDHEGDDDGDVIDRNNKSPTAAAAAAAATSCDRISSGRNDRPTFVRRLLNIASWQPPPRKNLGKQNADDVDPGTDDVRVMAAVKRRSRDCRQRRRRQRRRQTAVVVGMLVGLFALCTVVMSAFVVLYRRTYPHTQQSATSDGDTAHQQLLAAADATTSSIYQLDYLTVVPSLPRALIDSLGWVQYGGFRYTFIDKATTFYGGQERCQAIGGHLVHINTLRKQLFIEDFITQYLDRRGFRRLLH